MTRSRRSKWFSHLLTCALLSTPILPTAPAFAQDDEDFYVLPDFVVDVQERGYRRTTAVTANRLNIPIEQTPIAIQVVAEEFMRDTGIENLTDAFAFTSSVNTLPDEAVRGQGLIVRGFQSDFYLRDGFKKYYGSNMDGVDRVEVVKGPVSIFYGMNQPGGIINYIVKRPLMTPYNEIRLTYGSDDYKKALIDTTGPIIKDKVAYRVIASKTDADSWKDYVSDDRKYLLASVTWQPRPGMSVYVSYEYDDWFRTGGNNTALVGNENFYRDYYLNKGKSYGYQREYAYDDADRNRLGLPGSPLYNVYNESIRYIDPASRYAVDDGHVYRYPQNPRWEDHPNRDNIDQSRFPLYQQDVASAYQFPMLRSGSGNGDIGAINSIKSIESARSNRRGWTAQKWIESGLGDEIEHPYKEYFYPLGEQYNPNGPGAFEHAESHIANAEFTWRIVENVNFRYGFNYLENEYYRVRQFNSDPQMDGSSLRIGQSLQGATVSSLTAALGGGAVLSGAASNVFFNKYFTHSADLAYTLQLDRSQHIFMGTVEYRSDKFYDPAQNPGTHPQLNPDRVGDLFLGEAGTRGTQAVWTLPGYTMIGDTAPFRPEGGLIDLFVDSPPNMRDWAVFPDTWEHYRSQTQRGYGFTYRGSYLRSDLNVMASIRREEQRTGNATLKDYAPMVGVTYRLPGDLRDFTLYASYAESFSPISSSIAQTASYVLPGDRDDPSPTVAGRHDVVPLKQITNESGRGWEVGVKTDFRDSLINGSFSIFNVEKSDMIVRQTSLENDVTQQWLNRGIDYTPTIYTNAGVHAVEGVELDVMITPKPNWTINLSVSNLWTRKVKTPDDGTFYGRRDRAPFTESIDAPYPHKSLYIQDPEIREYAYDPESDSFIDVTPVMEDQYITYWREYAVQGEAEDTDYRVADATHGGWRPRSGWEIENWETLGLEKPEYHRREHTALIHVPAWQVGIWNRYDVTEGPLEGFSFGLGANYQSSSFVHANRVNFGYKAPSYILYRGLIRYTFSPKWIGENDTMEISLNINNLLDKRVNTGGAFGINDPRTWRLTVAYRF